MKSGSCEVEYKQRDSIAESSTDEWVQMQPTLRMLMPIVLGFAFIGMAQSLPCMVADKGRHFTVRRHRGRPFPGNRVCHIHLLQSFGLDSKERGSARPSKRTSVWFPRSREVIFHRRQMLSHSS